MHRPKINETQDKKHEGNYAKMHHNQTAQTHEETYQEPEECYRGRHEKDDRMLAGNNAGEAGSSTERKKDSQPRIPHPVKPSFHTREKERLPGRGRALRGHLQQTAPARNTEGRPQAEGTDTTWERGCTRTTQSGHASLDTATPPRACCLCLLSHWDRLWTASTKQ